LKLLTEEKLVIGYDTVGTPPKYIEHQDLLYQMQDIVDGDNAAAASSRRRTNVLGVSSMKHIKEELRERAIDLSRTSISNYTGRERSIVVMEVKISIKNLCANHACNTFFPVKKTLALHRRISIIY
jgi:hypothetical protein